MNSLRPHTINHVVLILLLVTGFLMASVRSQVSESADQSNSRGGTRKLTDEEAKLLLEGIKNIYGLQPDPNKIRVAEGRKAESVIKSLEVGGFGGGQSTCSYSVKGDVVSGVIIAEDKNMVYVDARPCELKIYSFRKPYTKTKVASVTCKGKALDRYAITQF